MHRPALALLVVAACGGPTTDIDATLVFAERSDAEIGRLIAAAGGTDMFSAQAQVDSLADDVAQGLETCPALVIDGGSAMLTGGCATSDGTEILGMAIIDNPLGFDAIEFQYGTPTSYTLTGFQILRSGYPQTYDGRFAIDDFQTWDADLTTTSFDLAVRSDLHYECSGSACSLEGSGIELLGVGGAQVSGTVEVTAGGSQRYTLRGQDTLTAEITQGCVAWQVSGTERQKVCAN